MAMQLRKDSIFTCINNSNVALLLNHARMANSQNNKLLVCPKRVQGPCHKTQIKSLKKDANNEG